MIWCRESITPEGIHYLTFHVINSEYYTLSNIAKNQAHTNVKTMKNYNWRQNVFCGFLFLLTLNACLCQILTAVKHNSCQAQYILVEGLLLVNNQNFCNPHVDVIFLNIKKQISKYRRLSLTQAEFSVWDSSSQVKESRIFNEDITPFLEKTEMR